MNTQTRNDLHGPRRKIFPWGFFLLIVSMYLFSELTADDGMILIGDVAFETGAELEACRRETGDEWDDEEFCFVVDELQKEFPDLRFQKVSHCAGILFLQY